MIHCSGLRHRRPGPLARPRRGRCSRFGIHPDLLALQGDTLGFSTLALDVRGPELLALQSTRPRLHFGIRARAVARRRLGSRFSLFALLFQLRQMFQFCKPFPGGLRSRLFGHRVLPGLFDGRLFPGDASCDLIF